jgi:hypothetical protein
VDDFFDLYLNQETSRYVFRILAVKLIMESPQDFGYDLPSEALYQPYETRSVPIHETIEDLASWAIDQGTTFKIVKLLNPWLKGRSLPVTRTESYEILLPLNPEQLGIVGGL